VPRFLREVARCDTGVELLGRRLPAPALLAPVGLQAVPHPEVELSLGAIGPREPLRRTHAARAGGRHRECLTVLRRHR
jgi:hypothetical protein